MIVTAVSARSPHRIDQDEMADGIKRQTFSNLLILATYDNRTFRVSSKVSFIEEMNDRCWPKALVPDNTMNVCYREIAWQSGESF